MSEIRKVYVNEKNKVTIICPQCGNVKIENAEPYRTDDGNRNTDITCAKCEAQFTVFVDFRKFYRKKTSLRGIVYNLNEKFCKITVENLSRNGVGFTMADDFTVKIDELIDVQFTLDDENRTFIRKRATVRLIKDNYIGAEFIDIHTFGKEIGFYLKLND